MNWKYCYLFSICTFIFSSYAFGQKKCSELTADVKSEIQSGQVKNIEAMTDGNPLPRVTIYSRVAGTPKEAMAFFCNFDLHKNIFPDISASKVTAKPDPFSWDVDYTMKIPLTSESYSIRNKLQPPDSKQNSFRLDWSSIKVQRMKSNQGFVIFEQISDGFVCMTYSNLVDLGNLPGLSLLKSAQTSKAKEAVEAFKIQLDANVKASAQLRTLDKLLNASTEASKVNPAGTPTVNNVK